jgi:hypothetical protein
MKFRKIVSIGGIGALALVALGFIFGPMVAETIAFRGRPGFRAMYRDFNSKTLTFPADALDVKIGAPTLAAAQNLRGLWNKQLMQAFKVASMHEALLKSPSEPIDATALQADLEPLAPLLDAFRRVVAAPDYQMDAMTLSIDEVIAGPADQQAALVGPMPNLMMIQALAKLAQLKGLVELDAGRSSQALEWGQAGLAAAQASSFDVLITQLVGIAIRDLGARAQARMVASIGDPALLRQALKDQQALAARAPSISPDLPVFVSDKVGVMRWAKLQGLAVADLSPMTERELTIRSMTMRADFIEQIALPKLKNDPKLADYARVQAKMYRDYAALFGGPMTSFGSIGKRIFGRFYAPVLFSISAPNFLETSTRDKVAQARMGLLQLETARRLYVVEHGSQQPKALADLAPAYLAKLPADPFAKDGAPDRLSPGGVIYSIGPDGRDDAAAMAYNPRFGTLSYGDVFFGDASSPKPGAESSPKPSAEMQKGDAAVWK